MIERIKAHWVPAIVVGIRVLWFIYGVYDIRSHPERLVQDQNILFVTGTMWLVMLWYTAAFTVPLVTFLRKRPLLLSLILEFVLSGSLFLFLSSHWEAGMAFYNFPVFIIAYLSGGARRTALWSLPVTVLGLPLLSGLLWGHPMAEVVDRWIDLLFVFVIGYSFRKLLMTLQRMQEMMAVIQQQNQTLELNARQIEQLTIEAERSRLSRELHDTVGHTFVAVITGMDAVRYLIDANPEEAKRNLEQLREYATQGLDEMRRQIHQLAPEGNGQPLHRTLEHIAAQFAEHTSVEVAFQAEGEEVPLSEQVRITLIRFLQETLTNAVRHGRASSIEVRLRYARAAVTLKVTDNGIGMKKLVKGFGINALSERLANVNGTLQLESSPQRGTSIEGTIRLLNPVTKGM